MIILYRSMYIICNRDNMPLKITDIVTDDIEEIEIEDIVTDEIRPLEIEDIVTKKPRKML